MMFARLPSPRADPTAPASYTVTKLAGTGVVGAADGNGAAASFAAPAGLTIDPSGTLYLADFGSQRIRRIDVSANVNTIAGSGATGSIDGSANTATFNGPRGIAYANGALFVADGTGCKIRQVTLKAGGTASPNSSTSWQVATLAGTGATGSTDGLGTVATFTSPQLLAVDPHGNIIEGDASKKIRVIRPNSGAFPIGVASGTAPTEPVQLSNTDGTIPNPSTGVGIPYIQYKGVLAAGATTNAQNWNFIIPNGVTAFEFTTTVEADPSILAPPGVVDNGPTPTAPNNVGSPDVEIRTLAGGGSKLGYLDGTVANARFNGPEYIATDKAGNLYLADQYNAAVRRISTTGVVSTIAGHVGGTPGYNDGVGNVAQVNFPSGIAVTPDGSTIYLADTGNQRIRRIALNYSTADPTQAANYTVSTIAGTGALGGTYASALGTTATFNGPTGLTLDAGGNLYVTEPGGSRVRRLQYTGGDASSAANWLVTILAGDISNAIGVTGTTDSTSGTSARFFNPNGITCDRAGNLYVADTSNHRIRKITPDGAVTTITGGIGGDVAVNGYADGPAVSGSTPVARLSYPSCLCVDSSGYLYVGDNTNVRIRRVSPTGYVTTVAGTGLTGGTDGTGNVAQFDGLASMAVGPTGTIYIGEVNNNGVRLLQRIVSSGTL